MPLMHTFIYAPHNKSEAQITLGGEEARHIKAVLRLGKGELVRLVDGQGEAHVCEIIDSSRKEIVCNIIKSTRNSGEPRQNVSLAIGLSSAGTFDTILEKGTEVGVGRFVPLYAEKGKVKPFEKGILTRKQRRWQRVCTAAMKQSGRSRLPVIDDPCYFDRFIASCSAAESVLFHPSDKENLSPLQGLLRADSVTLLVGPEAGFSDTEIRMAQDAGIPAVSLGSRILRTETAGTVVPALFLFWAEHLNQ
jgi:16S rRNA (uracil1498-N3)-methyltransferase